MSEYELQVDVEYLMYLFEQRKLSLKGVALQYDCECFRRTEPALKYRRMKDALKYRRMNQSETAAN